MVTEVSLDNGPSEHLKWEELACKDGTPYPFKFINDGRVFRLADAFEQVRHLAGGFPITILSAYRTPSWNRKIGGAKNSQHLIGCALDLRPPKNTELIDFHNMIRTNAFDIGIGGLGLYKTFIHIDIRVTSKLVAWSGTGAKDSRDAAA
jgi:hypothetical protein